MQWILGLLENNPSESNVVDVCLMVVHNLMVTIPESTAAFIAGSGIEGTCAALRALMGETSCMSLGSAVLCDFSSHPEIEARVMAARMPQLLSTFLSTCKTDGTIVMRLLAALHNTVYKNTDARAAFVEAGGIEATIAAAQLHVEDPEAMKMACLALGVFVNDQPLRERMAEGGFMELCVAMMRSSVHFAVSFGTEAATAMITTNPPTVAPFLHADGAAATIHVLQALADDAATVRFPLGMCVRLTNWQGGCKFLVDSGAVPVLVNLLAIHVDKHVPATLAVAVCLNLVACDLMAEPPTYAICRAMMEAGFMPALVDALNVHGEQDLEITSYAAQLLANYAKAGAEAEGVMRAAGIGPLLARLASKHEQIKSVIGDLLVTLEAPAPSPAVQFY